MPNHTEEIRIMLLDENDKPITVKHEQFIKIICDESKRLNLHSFLVKIWIDLEYEKVARGN